MLKDFYADNYKLFEELQIDNLKRVNLIVGENNVGKTALLEAIRLYIGGQLFDIEKNWLGEGVIPTTLATMLNLTYHERLGSQSYTKIEDHEIPNLESSLFGDITKAVILGASDMKCYLLSKGIDFESTTFPAIRIPVAYINSSIHKIENTNVVTLNAMRAQTLTKEIGNSWDKAALTPIEDHVINGLRLLKPSIERFTFIEDNNVKTPIVKERGKTHPIPLSSMGAGMTQMLHLIYYLSISKDKTFFIDEIETGLHWSIQKDMWKLILQMSQTLNIQVFATTHSRDAIEALFKASEELNLKEEASIVKLKRLPKAEQIKAVTLGMDQISTVVEQDLEIR